MKCPECNQQPTSLAKYIFGDALNIKCFHCGAWLKAGKFIRRIFFGYMVFAGFLGLGFVHLNEIYNWELGIFNIILIFTVVAGTPIEIIIWKYGVYEKQEPNIKHNVEATNIQMRDRVLIAVLGVMVIILGIISLYNHRYYIEPLIYNPLKLPIRNQAGNLLFGLITGLGFIISGYGLLRIRSWARHILLIITGIFSWGMVNFIIIWGSRSKESNVLYHFFLDSVVTR